MLLEKSKDLENMKNQPEIRQTSVELLEKEKEKRAFTKPKSEC